MSPAPLPVPMFVALDVETTGFDPASDRVIEIGAVRFVDGAPVDRFRSFVRPDRAVPAAVEALTGITSADLVGAPAIEDTLIALHAFVGTAPVVGHNVAFDLGFLGAGGWHPVGAAYDTFELASVLLPRATRLDLQSLTTMLEITLAGWHRAEADAEATGRAFAALQARLVELPASVRADLARIAARADAGLATLYLAALDGTASAANDGASPAAPLPAAGPLPPPLGTPGDERDAHDRHDARAAVTPFDVQSLFERIAARTELLPQYEPRLGQLAMATAVAEQLAHGGHLAVEAGTGTGKSLAYLLPAALHALRTGQRVVVATHTLNLQEQLIRHDLPIAAALAEQYEGAAVGTVQGALLKGRANYLCLERWVAARDAGEALSTQEARLLGRIAVWLADGGSGDMGDLYFAEGERDAWRALSAEGTDCLLRRCAFVRDGSCVLLRARATAAASHIVVVNHALLLASQSADRQVLPPFRHLVIDEAHRLEEVATQQYGSVVSTRDIDVLAAEGAAVAGSGPAAALRAAAAVPTAALSPAAGLHALADALAAAAARLRERVPTLERTARAFIEEFEERGGGDTVAQVTAARRAQPAWEDVEIAAVEVDLGLFAYEQDLARAVEVIDGLPDGTIMRPEFAQQRVRAARDAAQAYRATLRAAVLRVEPDAIVWASSASRTVRFHVAPLTVDERLRADVYESLDSVTFTSATLRAQESFDFTVQRLGLLDPTTLAVPSPFDYRRAVLTLVVDDIPEPGAPGYEELLHRALGDAIEAAGGRTLALFTSHGSVRATASAMRSRLAGAGITVLAQQVDGSPARLLRALTNGPPAAVLGTAALWEGVDVRGEALSQLAIARLPFPVPTDPIYAGRAALYDEPFTEYALPQAVLRFRQGFGRLIRGSSDRGVFLVLDRRVVSRPYGAQFLSSLPDCEVRRVPVSAIGDAVRGWLARGR